MVRTHKAEACRADFFGTELRHFDIPEIFLVLDDELSSRTVEVECG